MTVADLLPGESAVVLSVGADAPSRLRLMDLGILPGVPVTLVRRQLLSVHGVSYAIERRDAAAVLVIKAGKSL